MFGGVKFFANGEKFFERERALAGERRADGLAGLRDHAGRSLPDDLADRLRLLHTFYNTYECIRAIYNRLWLF